MMGEEYFSLCAPCRTREKRPAGRCQSLRDPLVRHQHGRQFHLSLRSDKSIHPKEIQHFVMANTTGSAFSTVIDDADQFIYISTEPGSAGNTCSQHDPHVKRKRRWSINRTLLTYDSSHQWSYGGARSRGVPDGVTEGRREDETCLRSDKRMGGRRS